MNQSSRHRSRVLVVQTLFALEARGGYPETVFDYVANEFGDDDFDEKFARETINGIIRNTVEINRIIVAAAPEWPLDKIALIDFTVLKVGIYEIIFADDIPDLVAINEAVDISKEFGGYNNSKFVNGVLSNVMHHKAEYALL